MTTILITALLCIIFFFLGAYAEFRAYIKEKRSLKESLESESRLKKSFKKRYYDMMDSRDDHQKKMISANSSITVIQYENNNLKEKIKDLNNQLKGLSDSRDMYFKIIRNAEDDVKQRASRIRELEAALARAEGLNRAFAGGGITTKLNSKDVRL
ncbi:hypothetical protein SAMN05192529_102147 [Arachidicoccus rhizosphaerae]|uniref:Uncharacterized protein n=1 Tax=Arachidicoccus rhizosphaerae TaxID=551991 RepID=A0A1H3W5B8_9BACT|nr:hypothetical protein [Arachidicoccus rhizosphaerae]SDZ82295.1 hypothetical protein SAMN05192529_102147 [Arachidicoccus rhizosphaerae]